MNDFATGHAFVAIIRGLKAAGVIDGDGVAAIVHALRTEGRGDGPAVTEPLAELANEISRV